MSRETLLHLNTQTLIGFTDQRGFAWHYRAEDQGAESNHYPGAIPVVDVNRRLFGWTAESRRVFFEIPCDLAEATGIGQDGQPIKMVLQDDVQGITRSDTEARLGIFTEGYTRHQYSEWLIGAVSNLLGDSVQIGSAGVLKGGKVAWVSVETPDTIKTKHGVEFRPHILACTSFDGSLSTTYKPVVTNTVCDNTMAAALGEAGATVKVKHSRYSKLKVHEARDTFGFISEIADAFEAESSRLAEITVTDRQIMAFLDEQVPVPAEKGRSKTMAESKREGLLKLWRNDNRVAPWKNTAWGVVQMVNTFDHHEGIVRGATRAERNMLGAVKGDFDKLDAATLDTLNKVLAAA